MNGLETLEPRSPQHELGATTYHAVTASAALERLGTEVERGLSYARVGELHAHFGANQLAEAPSVPLWKRFARQFQEPVIEILIAASVIAGALGEWIDTLVILVIVLLNGLLGFLQEERAGRALAALQRLSAPLAKVVRDGGPQMVPAHELVPGDLVELETGDFIPADVRLVRAFGFRVQESALTGESAPVDKDPASVLAPDTALGDRANMAYMGTVAAAGKATAVVVATGMATELGRIAGMLQRSEPELTPLQRRLGQLGKILILLCLVVVVLIFLLQLLRGEELVGAFLLSVSLAVAAVPEGLPAVVTLALALGLQRMVNRNALVRRLPSVETLGSVTVICSDKTGTLTRNEMTVREVVVGPRRYLISGEGYDPHGQFYDLETSQTDRSGNVTPLLPESQAPNPIDPKTAPDLIRALTIAAWCNNARVVPGDDGSKAWRVIGDPTEGALLVAALKGAIEPRDHEHHVLYEIPFDSERKAMSVVVRGPGATIEMNTKGATEMILPRCVMEWRGGENTPLTDERRRQVMEINAEMAARALRVLALASRTLPEGDQVLEEEAGLVLAGLVGMIDPPREEAREAVARCRGAGIRPVLITGDHPATAQAIARELGIATDGDRVVTGLDLDALADKALESDVERISVYARVTAEHKLRVVHAWKASGHVVAMTGDGVNDAPAVKAADIGIAMGLSGTDVTKEASDMVLTDDNFASIVNAIEEGRVIFDNIQKFIHYLLSTNAGEVLLMLFAALVGWPAPLTAIQILWINLVTDGLPALALAMEPAERGVMRRRPRLPLEPVITARRGLMIVFHGLLIASSAAVAFALALSEGGPEHARGIAFSTLAFAQLFFAFGCRSPGDILPELGLFSNPYLLGAVAFSGLLQVVVVTLPLARPLLDITSQPIRDWSMILVLSLLPVTIVEVAKGVSRTAWQ